MESGDDFLGVLQGACDKLLEDLCGKYAIKDRSAVESREVAIELLSVLEQGLKHSSGTVVLFESLDVQAKVSNLETRAKVLALLASVLEQLKGLGYTVDIGGME